VRDRRRAETVREIKEAALRLLAEGAGAGGLSLRGVARAVGMTVQSLYNYFDSREALLTALVVDGHRDLAIAVQSAVDAFAGSSTLDRRIAATEAFREWALTNRSAFLLLYGTPVEGYLALRQEEIGDASLGLAAPFLEVVFEGWSPADLAALTVPGFAPAVEQTHDQGIPLPPGALAFFIELRARMHGLVMLELLGHLFPFNDVAGELFHTAMIRLSADVDAAHAAVRS